MKIVILLIGVFYFNIAHSQSIYKTVKEIEWNQNMNTLDTSYLYIMKIDTNIFKTMIENNSEIAIQFYNLGVIVVLNLLKK